MLLSIENVASLLRQDADPEGYHVRPRSKANLVYWAAMAWARRRCAYHHGTHRLSDGSDEASTAQTLATCRFTNELGPGLVTCRRDGGFYPN